MSSVFASRRNRSTTQFHIGRTDLRTTPLAQRAFWDTQDLGEFLGADELPATTSVRGFNPARWQLKGRTIPEGLTLEGSLQSSRVVAFALG
jgi:hypothetical protein